MGEHTTNHPALPDVVSVGSSWLVRRCENDMDAIIERVAAAVAQLQR